MNQQREAGNERVISVLESLTSYLLICDFHILCFYLHHYLQLIGEIEIKIHFALLGHFITCLQSQ